MSFFPKVSRRIDRVFLHCSASDNPEHDDISVIRDWHLKRGFDDVGYHYFIKKDGTVQPGRPIDKTPAAQYGHNRHTIAICLHGYDDFTDSQFLLLKGLCRAIHTTLEGNVTFHGHSEVSDKTCPRFAYKPILNLSGTGRLLDD